MKKFLVLILTILTVVSCGDEIEFNSPAMQGKKDGNFWKAISYSADIDNGGFLIEGEDNNGTVQLITNNDVRGTFDLGEGSRSEAIYVDDEGVVYSTAFDPDPSLTLYPADGQITVDNVEDGDPKLITGTFWFNAYSADGLKVVNFSKGIYYKVSLVGGLVSSGSGCLEATQASNTAGQNFAATDPSMPEYTDLCNAYKNALMGRINACGDASGSLQAIIDSLGDCMP
ncbi:DUF6252 family protein [Xanthomarina spongicola]|uniref:Uncharacterized protein n=1 Tax=Xanthomarina spongicola TaxID=570520 RepID=A0A316DQH8_9FLAO|nr:DUF6252 family protein [Xanthomarina spongicola]PWK18993.1 hypothetical protein LX78_01469 [Xanthomarina spongicola]